MEDISLADGGFYLEMSNGFFSKISPLPVQKKKVFANLPFSGRNASRELNQNGRYPYKIWKLKATFQVFFAVEGISRLHSKNRDKSIFATIGKGLIDQPQTKVDSD